MNGTIKAIETKYKGYRFRSRLEARWAVFFDALGVEWEYEKEGFSLENGESYLPDFWLPKANMWAEVKPEAFTDRELRKCGYLVKMTDEPCLLLDGVPARKWYPALSIEVVGSEYHNGYRSYFDNEERESIVPMWGDSHKYLGDTDYIVKKFFAYCLSDYYIVNKYDKRMIVRGVFPQVVDETLDNYEKDNYGFYSEYFDFAEHAINAARSARFEHGENGGPR